jgi:hypothetical protein
MSHVFPLRLLSLAALSLAFAACTDEGTPGAITAVPPVPEGAVQAMIQQTAGPEEGTMTYTVRIIAGDQAFAAYQGALTFVPGSMEVLRVTTPRGLDGETHLVNVGEAANGLVRFAAYAPEKFGTDEAFSIVVRPKTDMADAKMVASLEVAGQAEGKAYERTALRQSVGVMDRAGRQMLSPR